ncbi:TIGR03943 family protein [Paenibacillus sp. J5C_2022]|uniref:TIGR03943 family putative permease subunit n=1 Tax=Paenibacillus sp. J5C2022 TaxID=2977129 RepID=UPI0021D1D96A|nr:TIGR03943 family protein [Paenibacillus sp. J5C2022]MCU6709247.1 TIGR03943 family protein [Paenibacillus sp. J5C2022]
MMHHLLRAAILAGFAMLIVYLFRTGEMILYIAPRMEIWIKLSAIGLYTAAVYQVYMALKARSGKRTASCGCDHAPPPSRIKNVMIYGLFLFPLLLGFLAPTGTLGSALAAKKGVSLNGSGSIARLNDETAPSKQKASELDRTESDTGEQAEAPNPSDDSDALDTLFPSDQYTVDHAAYGKLLYEQELIAVPEKQFIETLTTLDLYREAFIGKEVEITGFVYREEEMGEDRIAVSRFAMNCCSADALPYGLMIIWPKAREYGEDEWVRVRGKLTTSLYREHEIIVIDTRKIERIEAPESPYVYPDLEFGS